MSSGRLILPLAEPQLTSAGLVSVGATMTVYITGTNTLASLYADAALGTAIINPQTSNAAGRFYAQSTVIWADSSQAYDVQLALTDGETFSYSQLYLIGAATNISGLAPINSPTFTGVPQAPTPATNDNSAKLATTAYVKAQNYAPLASPTFTGTVLAPTPAALDNSTKVATTAYVVAGPFGKLFTSGEVAISGTQGTAAHGLGAVPTGCSVSLRNKTPEQGYSAGQEVLMPTIGYDGAAGGTPGGATVVMDSTNVYVAFNNLTINNLSSGVAVNITNADWKFVFRAWN